MKWKIFILLFFTKNCLKMKETILKYISQVYIIYYITTFSTYNITKYYAWKQIIVWINLPLCTFKLTLKIIFSTLFINQNIIETAKKCKHVSLYAFQKLQNSHLSISNNNHNTRHLSYYKKTYPKSMSFHVSLHFTHHKSLQCVRAGRNPHVYWYSAARPLIGGSTRNQTLATPDISKYQDLRIQFNINTHYIS